MDPIIKWAGGKRQLLPKIKTMLPKYNRYYEPFVGGGALVFDLLPNNPYVSDINEKLINMYVCIRDNPEEVWTYLQEYDQDVNKEKYYFIRDNHSLIFTQEAARFIFLNKHCFNGLYRVNKKGKFNVPYNNSTKQSVSYDDMLQMSNYLQNVEIKCTDFSKCNPQKGDFVFFDSPYDNISTFSQYTKTGFGREEHVRLANFFKELDSKGVKCLLTNHNTELINNLYKKYSIELISVKRNINRNGKNRVGEEIIIKNY